MIIELINKLDEIHHIFTNAKNDHEYDFYEDVKPFVENIDKQLNYLVEQQPKILNLPYMNEAKFQLLVDNYKELSVECHFKRTSKKLFLEKYKAVHHDLNYILTHLGNI